ncbi:MAG: ATP-binding cassette domain-containing protein [Paracoccaceae bacterium]|nr:ATP-binding cassette domain-containing protein [Paracoccaceae bacterium]
MFKNINESSKILLPISLNNIAYHKNGNQIISETSLTIKSKGITVIMGPNGSGKSVLVRLLHGLLVPTKGVIYYGKHPLKKSIRKKQAMVFQTPTLLKRTVLANMTFVNSIRGRIDLTYCKNILKLLSLEKFQSYPAQLLSAGEKQRLALARALILQPHILFLDEPTANLDPSSIHLIEQILKNVRESGVKIIFITHDIGQAKRIADDIIFINKGKILEYTNTSLFFQKPQNKETAAYLEGELIL